MEDGARTRVGGESVTGSAGLIKAQVARTYQAPTKMASTKSIIIHVISRLVFLSASRESDS